MNEIKLNDIDYRSTEGLNYSFLKAFDRSPAHAHTFTESTAAMDFGSMLHCAILEPELFFQLYAVTDLDGRTKEYKAFKEANEGKEIVKQDDYDKVIAIRDALYNKTFEGRSMKEIIEVSQKESSVYWINDALQCKAKADIIYNAPGCNIIFDLKTCDNANDFYWNVKNYQYDRQASWYIQGLNANYENPSRFIFIAIEKSKPFGIKFYELDSQTLLNADEKNNITIGKYVDWLVNGADQTKCYSDDIQMISLAR